MRSSLSSPQSLFMTHAISFMEVVETLEVEELVEVVEELVLVVVEVVEVEDVVITVEVVEVEVEVDVEVSPPWPPINEGSSRLMKSTSVSATVFIIS